MGNGIACCSAHLSLVQHFAGRAQCVTSSTWTESSVWDQPAHLKASLSFP